MNLDEWIDIGISNGVVNMPEIEEKTFEEIYKQWFLMKINVIKALCTVLISYHIFCGLKMGRTDKVFSVSAKS